MDEVDEECMIKRGLKVYFSNSAGVPTCVDETGPPFGRNYDSVEVPAPFCDWTERCGPCGGYATACNSWSITYGCDYADIKFVNDHAYPVCSVVTQITFKVFGLRPCASEQLPKFRDWYVTQVGDLLIYVPKGTPLRPCDSFEIRLPFCCVDTSTEVRIELGQGFCDWDPQGYWGSMRAASHEFGPLGCASCFFDKDRGEMRRRNIDSTGQPVPGECDTLVLYNRNHSSTADCGSDATGNQPWTKVEIDSVPPTCTPIVDSPSDWVASYDPITKRWVFAPRLAVPPNPPGLPIGACDKLEVRFCDCDPWPWRGNKIFWTTYNATTPIETDSLNGEDWGTGFPKVAVRHAAAHVTATASALGLPVPNPTTGRILVPLTVGPLASGDATAHIVVVDASGRMKAKMSRNVHGASVTTIELDGSGWSEGLYLIHVEIAGETLSASVIINR